MLPRGNAWGCAARLTAFTYLGSKYRQLSWLLSLLPKCHHFCEPFCGSAVVTLNREPSLVETINDSNSEIVNFFKVLREHYNELNHLLVNTPVSREEHKECKQPTNDPIEKARRFFVLARQSFSASKSWAVAAYNIPSGAPRKQPGHQFAYKVDDLIRVRDRLRLVQIEHNPAIKVIKKYDRPTTLFYCDPPYVDSTRKGTAGHYQTNEMTDDDHRELSDVLKNCKGRVAISGIKCDLYDELYHGWYRHDKSHSRYVGNNRLNNRQRRTESLWTNYRVDSG